MRTPHLSFACVLAWLAVCFGCSPSGDFSTVPPSDTAQDNQARLQIGIREIKHDWTFYGGEFEADKWKDGTNQCKVVQRDKAQALLWEQDYYYSGFSYPTIDGTTWEFLAVGL